MSDKNKDEFTKSVDNLTGCLWAILKLLLVIAGLLWMISLFLHWFGFGVQ